MDVAIEESEKNAEPLQVVVDKDGVETTKNINASFKLGSQMARHTRSDKVFDSLYDDDRPVAVVQPGALWVRPDSKTWTETCDGPRLAVLGRFKDRVTAVSKGYRMTKTARKRGYASYPAQWYAGRDWLVMRRHHPCNIPDDKQLAANIINFQIRKIRLAEEDFAKEIREKKRPEVKPPKLPLTLADMYPVLSQSIETEAEKLKAQTRKTIANLNKNHNLTHKQRIKARTLVKKREREALKSMIHHIPHKVREPDQKFAAVAYLISPKYERIDEDTKYYGRKVPEDTPDPAPDKVYSAEDFDEAMLVCVLHTFPTDAQCQEFIDNKAKHDLEFAQVVCMEMYESAPLDFLLTQECRQHVPRGYLTDLQQKVIVEREERNKAGRRQAESNPELVQEVIANPDGTLTVNESESTKRIRAEMAAEKAKTDKLYQEHLDKIKEEEETSTETTELTGGGGEKVERTDGVEEVENGEKTDEVQEVEEVTQEIEQLQIENE